MTRRLLMIGLDGLEPSLAEAMMAEGELPALADLHRQSARFALDHGAARYTGLAWEHVASGLSPRDAGRFTAVTFDPTRYDARQSSTRLPPFTATLGPGSLVFDAPYFDLARAPGTLGMVNWGAHDPGVAAQSRPEGLMQEIRERFGDYPAPEHLYGLAWQAPEQARRLGEGLAGATRRRAAIAAWLLGERLPDWRLALVVGGEPHSAIEALWHGLDPAHPAHALPSQAPAAEALAAVYRATDEMVAALAAAAPDATLLLFNLHGMGSNSGDLPSMALLPELLYRDTQGRPGLTVPQAWSEAPGGLPPLGPEEHWSGAVRRCFTARHRGVRRLLRRLTGRRDPPPGNLAWMPARWYQPHWSGMRAFALPAFYDGRIRINLKGREARGRVALGDYAAELERLEALIGQCRDLATGAPVVACFERPAGADPLALADSEADLVVRWQGTARGFSHPTLGVLGPLPLRRTGGHTGGPGFAWFAGPGLAPGARGPASAFDVIPTALDLLGYPLPPGLSGQSRAAALGVSSDDSRS